MKDKNLNSIVSLLIIGGIVFVAIAQIIPWGQISVGLLGNVQFYSWGVQSSPSSMGTTIYYFDMVLNENTRNLILSSELSEGFIIFAIFGALVLPISLIALLAGCLEYRVFTVKKIKRGFISGIIAIVSIILFYIFIQFGLISNITTIANYYSYSTGFYIMIFAAILFFSAYIIKSKADSIEQTIETPKEKKQIETKKKSEREVYCTKCKRTVPDDAVICSYCGEKFENAEAKICPSCSVENTTNGKFCLECGNKLK